MLERRDAKQLKNEFPEFYHLFREVERNIGVRSDIALTNMLQIVEHVVIYVTYAAKINSSTNQLNLADKIFLLDEEELIPEEITSILNQLRIYGNKALQTPKNDYEVTVELYEKCCELLHWILLTFEPRVSRVSDKQRNSSQSHNQKVKHPTKDLSIPDLSKLTRNAFDTTKEYQAKVRAMSPVLVGEMNPYLAEYSLEKEVLPVKIDVPESIKMLIPFPKGYLSIDRHNARSAVPNEDSQPLYASFDVEDDQLIVTKLFTRLNHKVYKIKNIIQLPTVSPSDLPVVIQQLYSRAKANDVGAQYDLGMYFEIEKNLHLAEYWFQKGADQRHAPSIFKVAQLYYRENNLEKAMELFIKGANLGCDQSKYWLGFMFENGKGVNKNLGRAISWYGQIADKDLEAQFRLAQIYSDGEKKDLSKAAHWYKKAADQGHAEAKKRLLSISRK